MEERNGDVEMAEMRREDVGEDGDWWIFEEWWVAILSGKMMLCRC